MRIPIKVKNLIISLHKFNKLDSRIVQQISLNFNVKAEEFCKEMGIIYNIIKGNPVPSIDSKELKYIIDLLKNNILFKIEQPYQKRYRTKIIQKLVNGVETDNEQPKLENSCTGHNNTICNTCINFCTVTGSDSEF